ncbi:MAG: hypothetical protein K5879_09640 [Lachnospiraceae bacterium]|nr:hypothetical protein [Lachnospiraceae bacterium]
MKHTIKKGRTVLCTLLLAATTLFAACYTGLDNTENAIKREQQYSEEISDAKENDRETEQQLDEIMEAAGDVSLNDSEKEIPEKESIYKEEIVEVKESEVLASEDTSGEETEASDLKFRKKKYLEEHYEKHGIEMGFSSPEEYLAAANKVLDNPNVLHKKEKEDNDDVYYLEESNEFVVVSADGFIRTYFNPSAGIDYFNRQ